MQKWIASGNVTKEPQITMSKAGKPIANITIAVRQDFKTAGEYKSDFFNCVAFGYTAEYIGNYVQKGNKVLICGRLQNESWEKDGVKHYATKVIVDNCEGLTPKKKTGEQGFDVMGSQVMDSEIPF